MLKLKTHLLLNFFSIVKQIKINSNYHILLDYFYLIKLIFCKQKPN